MRQIVLIFLIILLGNISIAQQYHFSKRYDFNQSNAEAGLTVISTDSGSVVLLTTSNATSGGLLQDILMFLNDTGGIQVYYAYVIPNDYLYGGGYGNLLKLPNKELIAAGSIEDTSGNADAVLIKFNSIQDTMWVKVFGDTSFQSGWMTRHTKDNGFALTGQTYSSPYNDDGFLIKTDSNGIFQWQKNYGGTKIELTSAMDTCFDGGYILGGFTNSFGIGTPSNRCSNCYAIKTDSLGNLIWYRTFGGIYGDEFHSCLQSSDGNYVFAGHYVNNDPYYPNCNTGSIQSTPFIVKLDTSGTTVWSKTFDVPGHDITLWSIKELPNGDLIAAGQFDHNGLPNDGFRGLVVRVNSNGDSLWYLTYNGCTGNLSDSYLYDITMANDGCFIATGWVYPKLPDTGTQDIWVLKIDSNGCEVANCVISSTGELINNYPNDFTLYPNPSDGIFNIHNDMNAIIEETEVYSYVGEKVFSKNGTLQQIDLTHAANGIYFYSIKIKGGRVLKGKVIKE